MNQRQFFNFLFNLIDVPVSNDFATEKFLQLTTFAHRKCLLWKSCGLGFVIADFELGIGLSTRPDGSGLAPRPKTCWGRQDDASRQLLIDNL
jgi:hypothetical protein